MTSENEYRQRLNAVLAYLEENPRQELKLGQAAALAHFSKFHFQRVFSGVMGLSFTRVQLLQRLKRASYQLAYRQERSIGEIAAEAGFENAESFSRAFRNQFGQSPSEFRREPRWEVWQNKIDALPTREHSMMHVSIEEFPGVALAVYEHRGPVNTLQRSLQNFVAWRKARGLSPDRYATYNIVYDDPDTVAPEHYRFDIGVAVDSYVDSYADSRNVDRDTFDAQANVKIKTIPPCRCARIRHLGSSDSIGKSVRYLYASWLLQSGEEPADMPLFYHRVRLFPSQVQEHEQITDVYLPLK